MPVILNKNVMVKQEIKERFLRDTDETGRFIVKSIKTGRTYYVEPIDNSGHPSGWGDLDPVTKKFSSEYGRKYTGSITEKESLITKENGFENIKMLQEGESPLSYIDKVDKFYEDQVRMNIENESDLEWALHIDKDIEANTDENGNLNI